MRPVIDDADRFSVLGAEGARVFVVMRDRRAFYGTVSRGLVRGSVILEVWGVTGLRRFAIADVKSARIATVTICQREREIRIAQRAGKSPRAQTSADVGNPRRVRS